MEVDEAAAIVLGAAGALEPVVTVSWLGVGQAQWGYVLLGMAAARVAFDRFFGISTGWMRCMQSAQRLQAMLETLQYDWAAANAGVPANLASISHRLALLRTFTACLTQVITGETAEWAHEFNSNLAQLDAQTSSKKASRPSLIASPAPGSGHDGAAQS